jgi:hypothetical protein
MNPGYARVRAERNGLFPQRMPFRGKGDRTPTVRAARHTCHHRPRPIQIKRYTIVPTSRARVRQNCDCGMASLMRGTDREPFFNSIQFGYPPAKSIAEAVDDGVGDRTLGDDAEETFEVSWPFLHLAGLTRASRSPAHGRRPPGIVLLMSVRFADGYTSPARLRWLGSGLRTRILGIIVCAHNVGRHFQAGQ